MKTIIQLFEENVAKYAENPLLWEKLGEQYESTSYKETQKLVTKFAAGLISLGIEKADRVALLSEGRNDWVISELSVLHAGAADVPLSIKLTSAELEFRLNHSETKILIVSGRQASKIEEIRNGLTSVEKIIYLDEKENVVEGEYNKTDVYNLGVAYLKENEASFIKRKNSVKGSDMANITYTSGTTSDPKGIILSHRNYTANVEQALTLMDIPPHFRTLLILPLDHCFAHVAGIYSFIACGASLGTVQLGSSPMETLKNIPVNIKELKPDLLLSVPALAKNFRKNIENGIRSKGPKIEKLFNNALALAYSYNKEGFNKSKWRLWARFRLWLYDKILFSKIRENFGGKLKFFIGGGALLDIELQRFFYALGFPMFQGYGLSEATPIISSNSMKRHKLGSSGYLVQPMEIKICNDEGVEVPIGQKGEIVIKGENVMQGYWKNDIATKETVKDGWLYTGDMGYLDEDNYLYVLGRFKCLLISSDGEKYSPESIEETLNEQSQFIDQSMLHNNQDAYTIGLIVPKKDTLKRILVQQGVDLTAPEAQQKALQLIQQDINEYRVGGKYENIFPERWLPASFAILPEGFNEQNKFMNSTMKMVRGKITEHYQERIDFLFTPEGKNIINQQNIDAIKKVLVD